MEELTHCALKGTRLQHLGKYAYSLSWQELDGKIDTTRVCALNLRSLSQGAICFILTLANEHTVSCLLRSLRPATVRRLFIKKRLIRPTELYVHRCGFCVCVEGLIRQNRESVGGRDDCREEGERGAFGASGVYW